MQERPILRIGAKIMTPILLLFALYVQFHGDLGPGGGFQAGVLFAVGVILYALLVGLERARRAVPLSVLLPLSALGVLIYAGTGVVSLLLGGQYLDYSLLAHDVHHAQHLGIFMIELGVGITVCSVMLILFFSFAGRGR